MLLFWTPGHWKTWCPWKPLKLPHVAPLLKQDLGCSSSHFTHNFLPFPPFHLPILHPIMDRNIQFSYTWVTYSMLSFVYSVHYLFRWLMHEELKKSNQPSSHKWPQTFPECFIKEPSLSPWPVCTLNWNLHYELNMVMYCTSNMVHMDMIFLCGPPWVENWQRVSQKHCPPWLWPLQKSHLSEGCYPGEMENQLRALPAKIKAKLPSQPLGCLNTYVQNKQTRFWALH